MKLPIIIYNKRCTQGNGLGLIINRKAEMHLIVIKAYKNNLILISMQPMLKFIHSIARS